MKRNNISPSNHLRTNLCVANSQILKFVIERKTRILRIMALALLLIVGQGEGFSQTLSQNTISTIA